MKKGGLITGSKKLFLTQYAWYQIYSEANFSLLFIGAEGEPMEVLATSKNGKIRFQAPEEMEVLVNVPEGVHWSFDWVEGRGPYEHTSNVPVEIPEAMRFPETLEDKLKRMVAGMIREKWGQDSDEYETFEEATDFEWEDDEVPLSGYEVRDPVTGIKEKKENPIPRPEKEPEPEPETEPTAPT